MFKGLSRIRDDKMFTLDGNKKGTIGPLSKTYRKTQFTKHNLIAYDSEIM